MTLKNRSSPISSIYTWPYWPETQPPWKHIDTLGAPGNIGHKPGYLF